MEVGDDLDLDRIDSLVVKLVGHAVMAKAYGDAIKRDPALKSGFGKLELRHRTALDTLCGEIRRAAADPAGTGAAAPITRIRRQDAR